MKIAKEMFKAYDIRGVYPTQLNAEIVYAIGQGYVQMYSPKQVVVARDVRQSGPELLGALIRGITDAGADVIDIGPISTEMLYFAVGQYGYDGGITVSASHNPPEYNGLKMVTKGAEPVTGESGIYQLRDSLPELLKHPIKAEQTGTVSQRDVFDEYKQYILAFIDTSVLKPLTVVANANFGLSAQFAKRIFDGLPIQWSLLNGEPDGTFPKGKPDPFVPENRVEWLVKCQAEQPDVGLAWDADADRCFFATGDGTFVDAYYINAILADAFLAKHPGEKIIYDVRYTWAIIDTVTKAGGVPIQSRVGHSYIKQAMRAHDAIFCGESSGHYYFREYFYSDTGMIPVLLMLELMSQRGASLADLAKPLMDRYVVSGEINTPVDNAEQAIATLKNKYADADVIDETDKLSIEYGRDWRFNIRTSNTEPLLRMNLEAKNRTLMEEKQEEVLAVMRGSGQ